MWYSFVFVSSFTVAVVFTIEGSKFVSPGPPIAPQQQSVSEEVAPTTVVKKPHKVDRGTHT